MSTKDGPKIDGSSPLPDEERSWAATEGASTAKSEAQPGATPFTSMLALIRTLEASTKALGKRHTAAEEALRDPETAREKVPLPSELMRRIPPLTATVGGETITTEAIDWPLSTEASILDHHKGDADSAAPMLAVLERWHEEQRMADARTGYAAAKDAEEAAEDVFMAEHEKLLDAVEALLRIPTSDPAELAIKRQLVDLHFECEEDVERALDAMFAAAAGAPPEPRRGSSDVWGAALRALDAAKADDLAKLEAARLASEAVETEAPVPPALRTPAGGHYSRESMITEEASIPFDRRVELVNVLRQWQPLRAAAQERHGHQAKEDAWEASDGGWSEFIALMETPAPDITALTEKVRLYLQEVHCELIGEDIDTLDTVAKFLTDRDAKGPWGVTRIYQDLLHLTGQRAEIAGATPFDAAAWVSEFEALPGHRITPGGPAYSYPEAWPAERATDAEVTITDPIRLSAWAEYRRAQNGEDVPSYGASGVQAGPGSIDVIQHIFADDPQECRRLCDAIESRKAGPVGRERWLGLRASAEPNV